jgi:hypothetical protein
MRHEMTRTTGGGIARRSLAVLLGTLLGVLVFASPGRAAGPGFAGSPVFSSSGMAQVVFQGGTLEDLEAAAQGAGANGVWAQGPDGSFQLLVVGGPAFLKDGFRARFPNGLAVAAVTLTRPTGGAPSAPATAPTTPAPTASAPTTFIDAHAHLAPGGSPASVSAGMDSYQVSRTILQPAPQPNADLATEAINQTAARQYPDRVAFLAGGSTLTSIIVSTPADQVTPAKTAAFEQAAAKAIQDGASGFGELGVLHFSFSPTQLFIGVSPDHPLLMRLSDLAAGYRVPIVLHMEAVATDMPLPADIPATGNPARLTANIEAFERLLAHNRDTVIVWEHAGWDNTGDRTIPLMRRLLSTHSNLVMTVKIRRALRGGNTFVDGQNNIRREWMSLLTDYPDRFLLSTDSQHGLDSNWDRDGGAMLGFYRQLPASIAARIGTDNAVRVFRLK